MKPETQSPVASAPRRMQYIDALRGVSILLVVLHHVFAKMGPVMALPQALALRETFASFRMPLFFFLSGFFAWKMSTSWTATKLKSVLSKKICAQIIGTTVFASAYFYCFHEDIVTGLENIGSGKYWFTVVLFQMFLLYIAVMFLTSKGGKGLFAIVMSTIALAVYIIHIYATKDFNAIIFKHWSDALGWANLTYYFPYFVLGLLVRQYETLMNRLLLNRLFTFAVVTIFLSSILFINDMNYTTTGKLLRLLPGISGVLTLLALFYRCRDYFDSTRRIPVIMSYVGRHTLDIYFLHYFFIPDLAYIPLSFYLQNPILPMLAVGLTVSCLITGLSLLTSSVICTSRTLELLLFGRKHFKKQGDFLPKQA